MSSQQIYRFGPFVLDAAKRVLFHYDKPVAVPPKDLDVLAVLVENHGQLIEKADLLDRVWPGIFIEEGNLARHVSAIRNLLTGGTDGKVYIETVPKRGYRFVMPVEVVATGIEFQNRSATTPASMAGVEATPPEVQAEKATATGRKVRVSLLVVTAVALAALAGLGVWVLRGRAVLSFIPRDSVLIADFENHTGDPRFDEALQTAFLISLRQSRQANIFPEARLAAVLQRMGKGTNEKITPAVGREICQRENIRGLVVCSITRTGQEYALTAELIDPQTGEIASSHSERSYGEDNILDALDVLAGEIRRDLGESLYQIHRAGPPLPQVTTRSLTALKQYADGQSQWHRGKHDEAMTLFRAAVETDPDFAMAHSALGNGYYSYIYFLPEKGKAEYEKALSLTARTTDRERLSIQANFEVNQEHVDDAVKLFKTYLERYPDDWSVHRSYARVLRLHHRQPEAIEQFEQLLRIAPDDAEAYIGMATAYKSLGQFQKALDAYSQAFRLEPGWLTSGNINREYAFTLVALGQDEKAVQAFASMLASPGTRAEGLRSMGMLDLYHGRFGASRKRFEEELKIRETRAEVFDAARAHFMLAVIAGGEGDSRAQTEHLDASVAHLREFGPKVTWAALVGQEYARAGAVSKAEKLAEAVSASVDPRNAEDSVYFQVLLAEVALAKGNADAATTGLLGSEAEVNNDTRGARAETLARAFQQSGKTDQAIAWYEKFLAIPGGGAVSWEPEEHWLAAQVALGSNYATRDEKQKALTTLAAFLNLWKNADPNLALLKQAKDEYAKLQ